jgi:hypothetical protein
MALGGATYRIHQVWHRQPNFEAPPPNLRSRSRHTAHSGHPDHARACRGHATSRPCHFFTHQMLYLPILDLTNHAFSGPGDLTIAPDAGATAHRSHVLSLSSLLVPRWLWVSAHNSFHVITQQTLAAMGSFLAVVPPRLDPCGDIPISKAMNY